MELAEPYKLLQNFHMLQNKLQIYLFFPVKQLELLKYFAL